MESVSREKLTADFGEAFLTLQHTYNICMQLLLGKYGLYPGQPQVLFALSKLGAPTQNELAAHLGIGKASAGVSIRRLETGGFMMIVDAAEGLEDEAIAQLRGLLVVRDEEDLVRRRIGLERIAFFKRGGLDALRSRLES